MSTTFPTSLQDLDGTRGTTGQPLSNPNHITHHTTEDDTIEALQAKVGINNSVVTTSLDYITKHLPVANISATGTLSASTFLRGDGAWALTANSGFGAQTDGAVVFDGINTFSFTSKVGSIYTLNRNVQATTISVSAGVTIIVSGYCMFGTSLTNGGIIHNDAGSGSAGNNASGATGGTGGAKGTGAPAGFFPAGADGGNGGAGANNGGNGTGGSVGSNTTNTIVGNGSTGNTGITIANSPGAGGSGGTASSETVGTVILGTFTSSFTSGSENSVSIGYKPYFSTTIFIGSTSPGSGGGGGGSSGNVGDGGGGGGGGGGSAGWVYLAFGTITNTGTIRANGGAGGNGGNGGASAAFGGGGAGGNGGIVFMVYNTLSNSGTIQATGGTKGSNGVGGSNGTAGKVYELKII